MSMNKFMHPENIYKVPPDYTELAIRYPEFRRVARLKLDGTVSIDMKSKDTLKVLTKCLLSRDFGLEIDLPDDHLVPTVPLRLNYILWLQDIMKALHISDRVPAGIDIGCGGSCVYSLLAARKNGWRMTALESNPTNVHYARENIKRNDLTNLVSVFHQADMKVIFKGFLATVEVGEQFDFCLCNPPFFESDLRKVAVEKSEKRRPPANESTGVADEIACEGGEVAFVRRILEESLLLKGRIRVYTTMLGHKTSSISIVKLLKDNQITNFTETEFCQGNTTRWGLAWSFDPNIILRTVPSQTAGRLHKPLKSFTYTFPTSQTFPACTSFLDKIFSDIHLSLETTSPRTISTMKTVSNPAISLRAKAHVNHWTKIRRKRRAGDDGMDYIGIQAGGGEGTSSSGGELVSILTFQIDMSYCETKKEFTLTLTYLDGSSGVNGLYELYQFLKNRIKELEEGGIKDD